MSTEGDQYIRDFKKSESEVVKLEYLNFVDLDENTGGMYKSLLKWGVTTTRLQAERLAG